MGVVEPGTQLVEHRDALGLPHCAALVWVWACRAGGAQWRTASGCAAAHTVRGAPSRQIPRIEPETFQDLDEAAPGVRSTCQVHQCLLAHHRRVAAVAVGMQCAAESRK